MNLAVLLLGTGLLFWAIVLHNLLARDRARVQAAWSDVEVQLKRRHDLIPIALALTLAPIAFGGHAEERIVSFESRVEVNRDSSLDLTETNRVRAEEQQIRRSIFREFPTTYRDGDGHRHTVGLVSPPSAAERTRYFVDDNRPAIYAGTGLAVLLAYYFFIWLRVGRDPSEGIVIPRYRPPDGESPASMRLLSRMAYDNRCFVAGVLSLAVKGWLTIEQGRSAYTLTRKPGAATPLAPDEHDLLRTLFVRSEKLELDDSKHAVVSAARRAHEKGLKRRYTKGFFHINGGWHWLGVILSIAVGVAMIEPMASGQIHASWLFLTPAGWVAAGMTLAGFVSNGVFGRLLKASTAAGRQRMDEIAGFHLYLDVAEGDEIKLVTAPRKTPGLFEAYLPFALALGVEQRWAEKFAQVFLTQAPNYSPDWYHGDRWDTSRLDRFSSSLGSSFDSAISAASTPPGSSSGSDGGGSSGGGEGGGGGGGGGW